LKKTEYFGGSVRPKSSMSTDAFDPPDPPLLPDDPVVLKQMIAELLVTLRQRDHELWKWPKQHGMMHASPGVPGERHLNPSRRHEDRPTPRRRRS